MYAYYRSDVQVSNTVIAGNRAAGGDSDVNYWVYNPTTYFYNLIGDGGGLPEAPVGSPDAKGNLIGGPVHGAIDPKLGSLVDNGGATFLDGSKMLSRVPLLGSPVIDTGFPTAKEQAGSPLSYGVSIVPPSDQRRTPFTRIFGGRLDMGAIEAEPAGFLAGDYNGDGTVDAADYALSRGTNGTSVAAATVADGNGDGKVDALDYSVWKTNFGLTLPAIPAAGAASLAVTQQQSSLAGGASIGPIVVDTLSDVVDANDGVTSLREAIATANAAPGAETGGPSAAAESRDRALLVWFSSPGAAHDRSGFVDVAAFARGNHRDVADVAADGCEPVDQLFETLGEIELFKV